VIIELCVKIGWISGCMDWLSTEVEAKIEMRARQ